MLAPRSTRAGAAVVLVALLAGCSGRIELPAGPSPDGGQGTGRDGDPDDRGGRGGTVARPAAPRGQGADQREPGTASGAGATADDLAAAATGPPGGFAKALLGPGSTRVVVEVLAQQGAAPRGPTLAHLGAVLRDASGKEVTTATRTVPGEGQVWTAAALRSLAERHGEAGQGGGQVVVRLLFLRGRFADEGALGVAVQGDTAAVFSDKVAQAGSLLTGAGAVEDAVTLHEVGHLLGLVDLVLRTGRADPEHPGHSPNRSSVMYWAVESTLIADVLTGGPPRDFDGRDRSDLAAIRRGS